MSSIGAQVPDRQTIAGHISSRLKAARNDARKQWNNQNTVRSVVIDNLLPATLAHALFAAFPPTSAMVGKSSIRERKYVAAQMDRYEPLIEEAVYAFQQPDVMALVADITGLQAMEPDAELYAGGISAMPRGAYLRPHLDNSHDAQQARYRVLNLLYYSTPNWDEADGGALQLWDEGPRGPARTLASKFNRLVLMGTDRRSWHSVNEVTKDDVRRCISNYYFSQQPPEEQPYFHATSFRAEHGQGLSDLVMRADNGLRTTILKLTGEKVFKNPHRYEPSAEPSATPRDAS
jgi:Rps23 Pro-64 3,4-dihydroxylase Tpa1-like proline 4-hydroxylase